MAATGRGEGAGWKNLDDVLDAMGRAIPALAPARDAAPGAAFRMSGAKIPREPHRYSGRTAMLAPMGSGRAQIDVNEPKPPDDPDSPLSFSMEGTPVEPPGALIPFFWSPGWNSIQATNKFQSEIAGALKGGDPGVRLIEPASGGEAEPFPAGGEEFAPPAGKPLTPGSGAGSVLAEVLKVINSTLDLQEVLRRTMDLVLERLGGESGMIVLCNRLTQELEIAVEGRSFTLPLRTAPGLAKGLAGIAAGLPDFREPRLPAWVTISIPS